MYGCIFILSVADSTEVYNCLYEMFLLIHSRWEGSRLLSVRGGSPTEQLPDREQLRLSQSKCAKPSILIQQTGPEPCLNTRLC